MAGDRFDVVLLGATGFTGGLTAEYLARQAPSDVRWALAGRSLGKLEAVRARLASAIGDSWASLPLVAVDLADTVAVRALAESTRVIATTVGPYLEHGEPVVAACAAAGTGYVDLTGEPEFVDTMYARYDRMAQESGARLVHSCGFDSIPYDLGALWTVSQLPDDVPIELSAYLRASGTVSGGTLHSAVQILARLRQGGAAARARRALEGAETVPPGRRVRGRARRPHRDPLAGGWVVPMPTIDPQNVLRSARALPAYGPDFGYAQYIVTRRALATGGLVAGAGSLAALAQLPPTRSLLLRLRRAGDGPSAQTRERSFFRVRFVARTPDTQLITQVSGGDPGYGETAKMLAESALCLAFDGLPERAGQLTPAVAMGQSLIDRLIGAGIRLELVDGGGSA